MISSYFLSVIVRKYFPSKSELETIRGKDFNAACFMYLIFKSEKSVRTCLLIFVTGHVDLRSFFILIWTYLIDMSCLNLLCYMTRILRGHFLFPFHNKSNPLKFKWKLLLWSRNIYLSLRMVLTAVWANNCRSTTVYSFWAWRGKV